MKNKLKKKYGLVMAICMVVGIVMGSGVFFKAQNVLEYTNGNMLYGVLAWIIGGIVMIICARAFGIFASKYEKINGLVDYSEAIVGKKYGFMYGWFLAIIYFPAMAAVLAWVSARYTLELFGSSDISGGLCMTLAGVYLIAAYALNTLSPYLAGKFHVSTTIIKLIPLITMIIIGIIAGIFNGNLGNSFSYAPTNGTNSGIGSIFKGIVAASFAYEGWSVATSINSEIKDSKKNLPKALIIGTIIIMSIYVLYFIGLAGATSVDNLINIGSTAAFKSLFGDVGGTLLNVFLVISCLGTLNGLMLANTRALYSIAVRNEGPKPDILSQVDYKTNMPTNASIVALLICVLWLFYFFGANLFEFKLFGLFSFDSSELPIITTYALYIPIFIIYIKKYGKENKRDLFLCLLALLASIFMVCAAIYAHGIMPMLESKEFNCPILFYLIIFILITIAGFILNRKKTTEETE